MMLLGCVASQTAGDVPATGYPLDDDGTNAAAFNQAHLPTIAPDYTRATYTLTGTTQTLVALPAVIDGVPGLVALTEGVPRVCGFLINSVPGAGDMSPMNFGLYNYGGSGSVLLNVEANKDDGATTGEIKAQAGTYPPSVTQYGSSYFGELVGTKIAIQATLSSGLLTAKAWVNGTLLGTSTGIATNGGVFALMQIIDGNGSGAVDIQAIPLSTLLADGYGAFDTGAIDMINNVIP